MFRVIPNAFLVLAVLWPWAGGPVGVVEGCSKGAVISCSHYPLVSQALDDHLLLLDPRHLDTRCRQLEESLRCILGLGVLGTCSGAVKAPYVSLSNQLQFPCRKHRSDYLSNVACWESPMVKMVGRSCNHALDNAADFCTGQRDFVNCVPKFMLQVSACGPRERFLLHSMAVSHSNDLGLFHSPPCPALPTPQEETTPSVPGPTPTDGGTTTASGEWGDGGGSGASSLGPGTTLWLAVTLLVGLGWFACFSSP